MTPTETGCEVTVTAHALIRDLYLHADRLHPRAGTDTGLTTLLPGDRLSIAVHGRQGEQAEVAARCAASTAADGDHRDQSRSTGSLCACARHRLRRELHHVHRVHPGHR
ncbi:hypothetical protein GCM10010404_54480 [Nonomuraea africana]